MECVRDPAQTTAGTGQFNTIAAQCCKSDGTCHRSIENSGCVAGHSKNEGLTPTTYSQAVAMCEEHGLELCTQSCRNTGCLYNRHPVWTALPCMDASGLKE